MRPLLLLGLLLTSACQDAPLPSPASAPTIDGLSLTAPAPEDVLELAAGDVRCGDVLWQDGKLHISGDDGWRTLGDGLKEHAVPGGLGGALLEGDGGPLWLSLRSGDLHRAGSPTPLASFGVPVHDPVVLDGQPWALSAAGLQGLEEHDAPTFDGATALAADDEALWLVTPNPRGDGILHRWRPRGSGPPQDTPVREGEPSAIVALQRGGVALAGTHLSRRGPGGERRWIQPLKHEVLQLVDAGDRIIAVSENRLEIYRDDDGVRVAAAPLRGACAAALGAGQLFVRDRGGVSAHDLDTGQLLSRQHTTQRPARVVTDPKTGDRFVLDADGGAVYVWRPGQAVGALPGTRYPLALSRERGALVALDLSGELLVWDIVSRALTRRIQLGTDKAGVLAHDPDRSLAAVLYPDELLVADLKDAVLWRVPAEADALAAGGGRVYLWSAAQNTVTARDARSGALLGAAQLPAPPRRRGALRTRNLFYDPTTDRLFCGRDILDGETLALMGRIDGIDQVVHADQRLIVGQKASRDGTASAVLLDPTALTLLARTPLARLKGADGELSYDPNLRRLYLSEAGRGRVLSWSYPH